MCEGTAGAPLACAHGKELAQLCPSQAVWFQEVSRSGLRGLPGLGVTLNPKPLNPLRLAGLVWQDVSAEVAEASRTHQSF